MTKTTFSTQFIDGHIIVSIDNYDYLVDTGSPFSFGKGTNIFINGKTFPITTSIGDITPESINALSGLTIDGLIGMNILRHFDIRFTLTETTFSDQPFTYSNTATRLPIVDTSLIVPIIHFTIENENQRLYFDTGAKLAYLSDDLLVGRTSSGQQHDFHPSIGAFTTNVYKFNVQIGQEKEDLTFGSLPSLLTLPLVFGRTKGILGTELLSKYTMILSNLNNTLVLESIEVDH